LTDGNAYQAWNNYLIQLIELKGFLLLTLSPFLGDSSFFPFSYVYPLYRFNLLSFTLPLVPMKRISSLIFEITQTSWQKQKNKIGILK